MYSVKSLRSSSTRGFTIIELLIVIVIIGVLVAITAVSYTGITRSANEAAVKSDLKQARTALDLNKAKTGIYPVSLSANIPAIAQPKSNTLAYIQLVGGQSYSLSASSNANPDIAFQAGPTDGVGQTIPFPSGSLIQTATKANCPIARTMAIDARDKSTYWIQKLADGNCWMLTNLAYAGGTANGGANTYNDVMPVGSGAGGSIANGTGNTSASFTDAKYYIPPGANPTIDPTPPSTATDGGAATATRQFGYYYNWCAAMGGQNTGACANATTPVPTPAANICPSGWRLPTGGSGGEFTALNNAINGGQGIDSGLLSNGLFQRNGFWNNGFGNQGAVGYVWSSTQHSATYAYYLYLSSTSVDPTGYGGNGKSNAFAVRCIAQ